MISGSDDDVDQLVKKIIAILRLSTVDSCEYNAWSNPTGISLKIRNLDMAHLSQIFELEVFDRVTALTLSHNNLQEITYLPLHLEHLRIINNPLNIFDLPDLVNLKSLSIKNTNLSELDVSTYTKLEYLEIEDTNLESLDLTHNTRLESLIVRKSKLKQIDVKHLDNLVLLDVSHNELVELDVTTLLNLQLLYYGPNYIEDLNIDRPELLHDLFVNRQRSISCDCDYESSLHHFFVKTGYKVPDSLKYLEKPVESGKGWSKYSKPIKRRFP